MLKIPFYLTGYERSGTTLIRRIMSMHPSMKYDIVHEQANILMRCKSKKEAIQRLRVEKIPCSPEWGVKQPYRRLQRNVGLFNHYMNLFPDATVVHIVRDPLWAINSQVRTFKSKRNPGHCIKGYFNCIGKFSEMVTKYPHLTIDYDKYVADPFNQTKKLYEWMGEEVEDSLIEKIISSKMYWNHGDKKMVGLRYAEKVGPTNPELVLEDRIVKMIEAKKKTIKPWLSNIL